MGATLVIQLQFLILLILGQTLCTQGYRSGIEPTRQGFGTPPEANALPPEKKPITIISNFYLHFCLNSPPLKILK